MTPALFLEKERRKLRVKGWDSQTSHEPQATTGVSIPALTNPHKLGEMGLVTVPQAEVWFTSPALGMVL